MKKRQRSLLCYFLTQSFSFFRCLNLTMLTCTLSHVYKMHYARYRESPFSYHFILLCINHPDYFILIFLPYLCQWRMPTFILLHAEEIWEQGRVTFQRSVELIDGNKFHCRNEGVAKHSAFNLGDNRLSQVMLVQSIIAIQLLGHLLQSEVFILAPFSRYKNRQAQNCSTYFPSGNNNCGSSRDFFYYYYCTLKLLQ